MLVYVYRLISLMCAFRCQFVVLLLLVLLIICCLCLFLAGALTSMRAPVHKRGSEKEDPAVEVTLTPFLRHPEVMLFSRILLFGCPFGGGGWACRIKIGSGVPTSARGVDLTPLRRSWSAQAQGITDEGIASEIQGSPQGITDHSRGFPQRSRDHCRGSPITQGDRLRNPGIIAGDHRWPKKITSDVCSGCFRPVLAARRRKIAHVLPLAARTPRLRPISVLSWWFQRLWLKHNLNSEGWNYHVHREFPGKFESSNLSRDNFSREIVRMFSLAEVLLATGPSPLRGHDP